jgi:hypothetical protein
MSLERDALAGLADDVATALTRYAQALRAVGAQGSSGKVDSPGAPRGPRQRAVLQLAGITSREGLTAGQVAEGAEVRQPNAYTLLNAMVEAGWLEVVPDAEPTHWRTPR